MRVTASATIIILSYISAQVAGLVLRPKDTAPANEPLDLIVLARDYITELTAQNQAIDEVEKQLSLAGGEGSTGKISELCDGLLESYYRQTEPRNRMVEITPTDSVLDSASIEYLVAVASRYATNVMHLARKLRRDPIDQESLFEDVNNLRKEHSKTQMFDQILLELANVSLIEGITEPTEDMNISNPGSEKTVSEEKGADITDVQTQTEKEGEDEVEVVVKVEQEIHTTTTETVVKSYTETSASW